MYEEEKKSSFIRDLIIKLLYFFLFLFLFIWLYPAPKVNLDDVQVNIDEKALEPLYKQIFNDNITSMKEAGKSYFTNDRLPNKVGEKVRITLKDMLNKKLLLEFTDEEGNSCNESQSFVEVTKSNDSEYNMKVYLACNSKKDYINEIIGCTDVCPSGTCNNVVANNGTTTNKSNYSTNSSTNKTTNTQTTNKTTTVYTPSNTQQNNPAYVTVYFDSKGGSYVDAQKLSYGATAYEPVTSREGYKFKCWSTSVDDYVCTYRYNFSAPVYENKTLYAQWTQETVQYEYVKTTWTPDYTWTTEYKTGDNIKRINTTTSYNTSYERKSYTYRTVSWYSGSDQPYNYGLFLNNIPYNATNVRFSTYPTRFTSRYELQNYMDNRYSCVIQQVGSSCPKAYDYGIIQNNQLLSTPVGDFSFTNSSISRNSGKWRVDFYITPYNYTNVYQYIAPIKFTVSWDEPDDEGVTKYQYSYKTTDTKYSTSSNDTYLLNSGYKLTGRTK